MMARAFLAVLLLLSGAGPVLALRTIAESDNSIGEIRPLTDLVAIVEEKYAGEEKLKTEDIMSHALGGMVRGLDRYSEFLDQQKFKDLQDDTRGSFEGIGIAIGIVNDKLQVIAPIEGTPADRAGLLGGDVIAYIDGVPTDGMKIMDAVHRIKGPKGTKVVLTILREGDPPRDVAIKRDKITPVNIRDHVIGEVGYVAVRGFSRDTSEKLDEALSRLEKAGVKGLILDLRSNPGGLLEEAQKVADLFLPPGKLIVSTEGRDPAQKTKRFSVLKPRLGRLPMVVLTNENSASASEIVAGALKDWDRAVIVGRRTFGKASVQSIQQLSRTKAQALRMTVAHYYTPGGDDIHESGIEPDVVLPPRRYPTGLRELNERQAFQRVADRLVKNVPVWLDPAALKEGLLRAAPKSAGADKFEIRLENEFIRMIEEKGWSVSDSEWIEVKEEAVDQLRIEVMRKVKGEESARRFAAEFDPQVKTAVSLLKLAAF